MNAEYFATRLAENARRDVVWRTLCDAFFSQYIDADDTVLDLGAGYGSFINHVRARHRIAVDGWDGLPAHVAAGVEAHVGSVLDLSFLADGSVDFSFASNLLEHLSHEDCGRLLAALRPKLSAKGTVNLVQPNFRHCAAKYFDDFTHITVFSHVSLADFLEANGFEVLECRPRFLPLTVKSRMPTHPLLIRAYLMSPVKPMAGQMFVRARPRSR